MKKFNHLFTSLGLALAVLVSFTLVTGCVNQPNPNSGDSKGTYYNGMALLSVAYAQKIMSCQEGADAEGCAEISQLRDKFANAICAAQGLKEAHAALQQAPQKSQFSTNGGNQVGGMAQLGNSNLIDPNDWPIPPSPCQCFRFVDRMEFIFPDGSNLEGVSVVKNGAEQSSSKLQPLVSGLSTVSVDLSSFGSQEVAEIRFETGEGTISAFVVQ